MEPPVLVSKDAGTSNSLASTVETGPVILWGNRPFCLYLDTDTESHDVAIKAPESHGERSNRLRVEVPEGVVIPHLGTPVGVLVLMAIDGHIGSTSRLSSCTGCVG